MNKVKKFGKVCWQYDYVHTIVYAILLNLIIECLNKRSLMGFVSLFTNPIIFLYNTMIIMLTLSIALLCKRKMFAYSGIALIWLILAFTNYVVLCSRKTPFTAMDIFLLSDAIKVIPVYLKLYQMILIVIGVILAIAGLCLLYVKERKDEHKIHYLHSLIKIGIMAAIVYCCTNAFLMAGILKKNFGNLGMAYQQYGFAYCFSCSVVDRGISKSDEYSVAYMDSLKETLDDGQTENSEKTPNIIFLQLESFFDPNLVQDVTFTENPVPNYDKMKEEYSNGFLSVPCFGAGTANTEFEVQTGINLDDFGPGEYPYKTVLQSAVCESAAYNLKNLGYSTHALHNNDGTFYDRYKVFSHLGYDTFTSVEYMNGIEHTPQGWAKDKILTGEIGKLLDSTDGSDYIYTISVQGHGDYPDTMPEGYTPKIGVSGFFDTARATAFTYYVNQIHEMDTFLGELTDYLSQRDEETVLVLYGDHLPSFEFNETNLKNKDIYQTQYVIWSNFDMGYAHKDMEAYQLSAYVLGKLGISEGYITKFHQKQSESDDYLKNLKILEYDILYGDQDIYNGENPFKVTDLKMGTDPIKIDNAYDYKDYVCVEGDHFNDSSVVYINNKEHSTEIINDHTLKVADCKLKSGDIVSVVQRGGDKIELSRVSFTVN